MALSDFRASPPARYEDWHPAKPESPVARTLSAHDAERIRAAVLEGGVRGIPVGRLAEDLIAAFASIDAATKEA